jgi:hypothetical protein
VSAATAVPLPTDLEPMRAHLRHDLSPSARDLVRVKEIRRQLAKNSRSSRARPRNDPVAFHVLTSGKAGTSRTSR